MLCPVATQPRDNESFYLVFHDECIELKQNNYIFDYAPVGPLSDTAKAMYGLRTLRAYCAVKWSDTFNVHALYKDLT